MGFNQLYIEVANKNDLVELVNQYLLLKKSGKNYKGLCPFHIEKTPSFIVSPENQLWHCFGCGKGGNIYTFLMLIENIEFKEALHILAEKAGINLHNNKEKTKVNLFLNINQEANNFFTKTLFSAKGKTAFNYLINIRKFSLETIKKFSLGYAPEGFNNLKEHLLKKGFLIDNLIEIGLAIKNPSGNIYDRFRDRIMFPVFNNSGDIIGFGGRTMSDQDAKYINSPESLIFHKSKNLYGFNFAREFIRDSKEVFLVEGYVDVITLYQAGIKNVIASMGTSLTEEQVSLLSRFTDKVYVAYDGDTAGTEATKRGMEMLFVFGLQNFVLEFPTGDDPDSFIQKNGLNEFLKLKNKSLAYFDFYLKQLEKQFNINEPQGKSKIAKEIALLLAKFSEVLLQDIYLNQSAKYLGIDYRTLKNLMPTNSCKSQILNPKSKINTEELETRLEINLLGNLILKAELFWEYLPLISENIFQSLNNKKIFLSLKEFYKTNFNRKNNISNLQQEISLLIAEDLNKYLAEIIFVVEKIPHNENNFKDILSKIKERQIKKELKEIQNNLQEAEKNKNFSLATELANKVMSLKKEVKNLKINHQERV